MIRSEHRRALFWQGAVIAIVATVLVAIGRQAAINLEQRGIASGFGYLDRPAGFEVAAGPLDYSAGDTYGRALAVGLFNTLRVAVLAMLFATAGGIAIGAARLSRIWVASAAARVYVEVVRNTPLLLQLLFWYALWQRLPGPRDALRLPGGALLCDRGLFLPRLVVHHGGGWLGTLGVERPALVGFGIHGGMAISPEFAALLIGLSIYTAAFLGETVRGGILAVARGQTEAAEALGLSRLAVFRFVVFPQALRAIVPPATLLYGGLVKNSSLAVAIGYPDLLAITNATLNQTGQAIEAIAVAMLCYLVISVALAAVMHRYERVTLDRGWRRATA
jgi:general L-amino acid transport system permease protein